ncbi:MAG: ribokinase [Bacillota bacterium]|nr:ribokinase [Bacillota bacterium]
MYDIVVIGSINADLVFKADKRPNPGETLLGNDFKTVPGGKGANQAIAAARLGASVAMLGCLGNDQNGVFLEENLKINNVETKYIEKVNNVPSGVAGIVLAEGDNSIIVVPGANYEVDKEYIDKNKDVILGSKIVLLQLEIPIDVVEYVIDLCSKNKVKVILNPAPIQKLNRSTLDKLDFITPNEHEFEILYGSNKEEKILKEQKNKLIITKGSEGVVFSDGNQLIEIPSLEVEVVDTTGAGDTFNGAFAQSIVKGKTIEESIKFANIAGAISVTKFGAQGGMPTLEELNEFIKKRKV